MENAKNNTYAWYLYGGLHRENGPALVLPNGEEQYWRNGSLHREDGPAYISPDGSKSWYKNGKLHREDGPAMVLPDGMELWYKDGMRHREDGPAATGRNGFVAFCLYNSEIDIHTFADYAGWSEKQIANFLLEN